MDKFASPAPRKESGICHTVILGAKAVCLFTSIDGTSLYLREVKTLFFFAIVSEASKVCKAEFIVFGARK